MTNTNPLDRTAIDTVLIKLNMVCQYMEIARPSKQDVKKASEAAKDAADILKACLVLLDHDIYTVQQPPQPPGVPLFKGNGEPAPAADQTSEVQPPLPTLGIIDVEIVAPRSFKVGDKVKATATEEIGTVVEDDGDPEDEAPFRVKFEDNSMCPMSAGELEMVEAAPDPEDEDAAGKAEIMAEPFPRGTKAVQKKCYLERLDTLESCFCDAEEADGRENYQEQLKAFKPHRTAWVAKWDADAQAAWKAILIAIATATYAKTGAFTAWAPEVAA